MSDSPPPTDFVISSGEDPLSVHCPLCLCPAQTLTCVDCLLKGEFTHSSLLAGRLKRESYSSLSLRLCNLKRTRLELAKRCSDYTQKLDHRGQILDQIESYTLRTELQKQLKSKLQQRIADVERSASTLAAQTSGKKLHWPEYRTRLDNMSQSHRHKLAKVVKFQKFLASRKQVLKELSKTRILELRNEVFPLGRRAKSVQQQGVESSDSEDDTVSALISATSYCAVGETYAFGECGPELPADGNYAGDENEILAGLMYATQFVNLIAFYLDLRLPHRLSFSEFTHPDPLQSKFHRKVAKLNANVLHLCSSQGIGGSWLQPRRTMGNLMNLFDPSVADLGRRPPFSIPAQLAKAMESEIEEDLNGSDSSEEFSDDCFPSDWENVQRSGMSLPPMGESVQSGWSGWSLFRWK